VQQEIIKNSFKSYPAFSLWINALR